MNVLWNLGLGIAGAIVGSLVIAVVVSATVGYGSHPLESFPWLLSVSLPPAGLGGVALGRLRGPSWVSAAAVAFVVVVLAGSAGATIVQATRFGLQSVNFSGYFAWCWVYAAAMLPLTTPLAYAGSRLAWRQNS